MTAPLLGRLRPGWSTPVAGVDVEAVFVHLAGLHDDVVWLDSSGGGWHLLGFGGTRLIGDSLAQVRGELTGEPGPWVGWLGYEAGVELLDLPAGTPPHPSRFPQAAWLRPDRWLVVDGSGTGHLAARSPGLAWDLPEGLRPAGMPAAGAGAPPARPRHEDEVYLELIARCLELIRDGEVDVLCLTTAVETAPIDPVASHLRLRRLSPVPRGGFLRIGGTCLSSASMEQFLRVDGRTVSTRPIKGTRRRSANPREDSRLAAELASSPKEMEEHLAVVEASGDDLASVCEPDSVEAAELLAVEGYRTVHQLVSTLTGRLREGLGPLDALEALFPAGSMTGVPRRRAVELLGRLEGHPRGVYSGCFGIIDAAEAELAMVIRSVVSDATGAHVGVGGGITALSDPAHELAEVHLKAEALLASLVGSS